MKAIVRGLATTTARMATVAIFIAHVGATFIARLSDDLRATRALSRAGLGGEIAAPECIMAR